MNDGSGPLALFTGLGNTFTSMGITPTIGQQLNFTMLYNGSTVSLFLFNSLNNSVTRMGVSNYANANFTVALTIGATNGVKGISNNYYAFYPCTGAPMAATPDITPPQITFYNMTSEGGLGCTVWNSNKQNACNTTISTPTVKINLSENSSCAISTLDLNYTNMTTNDANTNCSISGASLTCILPASKALSPGLNNIFIGCKDSVGNENLSSTSSALLIDLTVPVYDPIAVHLNGTEIITGFKTFLSNTVFSITAFTNITVGNVFGGNANLSNLTVDNLFSPSANFVNLNVNNIFGSIATFANITIDNIFGGNFFGNKIQANNLTVLDTVISNRINTTSINAASVSSNITTTNNLTSTIITTNSLTSTGAVTGNLSQSFGLPIAVLSQSNKTLPIRKNFNSNGENWVWWGKGAISANTAIQIISLKLDNVEQDGVSTKQAAAADSIPFSLMFTKIIPSGQHSVNITATGGGALSNLTLIGMGIR